MKEYFGISGISKMNELRFCLNALAKYGLLKNTTSHIPMLGFLMNYRIFTNEAYPNNNRNITVKQAFEYLGLVEKYSIFKTIHYHTKTKNFSKEVIDLLNWHGDLDSYFEDTDLFELVDGIQLNISNPNPNEINLIKKRFPKLKIILQLNNSFLSTQLNFTELREKYYDNADYILIDPSGGKGKAIDLYSFKAVKIYLAIREFFQDKIIGFAGGFSGENVYLRLKRLKIIYGDRKFSIDSESKLRNENDQLDFDKVVLYISEFAKAIKS